MHLHKACQFFEDENKVVRNGGADKIVSPFASVHVCTHFYCKRDGKCRKVEAWVYNLREKSQRTPFCCVKSNADLEACFGFLEKTSGDICEACRKALQHYRNNGKTFHHVSVFLKFNFFYVTYPRDVKIKIKRCCMQLELQKCHNFIGSAKGYLEAS